MIAHERAVEVVRDEAHPGLPARRDLVLLPQVVQRAADVDRRLVGEVDRDVLPDAEDRLREVADDARRARPAAVRERLQVRGEPQRDAVQTGSGCGSRP
jgi:hypothetical protein